jgi:hypothetical protein
LGIIVYLSAAIYTETVTAHHSILCVQCDRPVDLAKSFSGNEKRHCLCQVNTSAKIYFCAIFYYSIFIKSKETNDDSSNWDPTPDVKNGKGRDWCGLDMADSSCVDRTDTTRPTKWFSGSPSPPPPPPPPPSGFRGPLSAQTKPLAPFYRLPLRSMVEDIYSALRFVED